MASLYFTKVRASGGRHGSIRSEDGLLDLRLALPQALGGRGDATNPEQLFAGGYAACFENAVLHVSRDAGHRFADTTSTSSPESTLVEMKQGASCWPQRLP
jgi:Ohr subfamily peroxiredoxin